MHKFYFSNHVVDTEFVFSSYSNFSYVLESFILLTIFLSVYNPTNFIYGHCHQKKRCRCLLIFEGDQFTTKI